MYTVKFTEKFEKKFIKIIPIELQKDFRRRMENLSLNPYVGKPLRYSFIRELKIDKFRVYFMIFENEVTVLLADVSDKKHQQEVINALCDNRDLFQKYVKNLNKGDLA